jgi:hypothetical protein
MTDARSGYQRTMTNASSTPDRSPEKPTEQWVTGDEPMTGPQQSYLATLAREAGEDIPDGLTKAQASEMIDRLQQATGRGSPDAKAGDAEDAEISGGVSSERGNADPHDVAARVQAEGIVDQQATFLDDTGEGNPT